ncbi:MAG: winged helix-turn-helix domain-containing protein [Negativicutes bacterium]|nr:winged helix-turn-helix domain-containing protein [Negativicutes bacterium]
MSAGDKRGQEDWIDKEKAAVRVNMLGDFQLESKDATVSEQINRSKKLWGVLALLLIYRKNPLNHQELTQQIWTEGRSKNPVNALKTLLYRLREMLEPLQEDGQQLIVANRGAYCWNAAIPVYLDFEEFEAISRQAANVKSNKEESIPLYQRATALYGGDFLLRVDLPWAAAMRAKYRKIHLQNIKALAAFYSANAQYAEIVKLCADVMETPVLIDQIHIYYIRALLHLGQHQEALMHYEKTNELYLREKGTYPSDEMRSLYSEIMEIQQQSETDLSVIQAQLKGLDKETGAFVCDYGYFKEAYRLECRRAERSSSKVYIALITVASDKGKDSELPAERLRLVMKKLLNIMKANLRRGDVISRYSSNQYVLLLPSATYENGILILNRILSVYYQHNRRNNVILHCRLQPLDVSTGNYKEKKESAQEMAATDQSSLS